MDRDSGVVCTPPRRLSRRTRRLAPSPSSRRRSGAGDDCALQVLGRKTKNRLRLASAASCRRRSTAGPASGNQATTAPTLPVSSARSQAQAASRPLALATSNRERATPPASSAGACREYGGATQTSHARSSPETCASTGSNRASSPTPVRADKSSVMALPGHPPPGNSASRSAKPVGVPCCVAAASAPPRQMSGRSRRAASVGAAAGLGGMANAFRARRRPG